MRMQVYQGFNPFFIRAILPTQGPIVGSCIRMAIRFQSLLHQGNTSNAATGVPPWWSV